MTPKEVFKKTEDKSEAEDVEDHLEDPVAEKEEDNPGGIALVSEVAEEEVLNA